jgi:uncharacterized protein with NRDE domain
MAFGLDPAAPLVVGANRDEHLDRPATAMTVLQPAEPRILGGRDELAGGTWLTVNAHGLVAGLTNRPLPDGPDPSKRSRGELPLILARHRHADEAVDDFLRTVRPADYNPAWLLVGDRRSLYAIDLSDGERPTSSRLGPGLHILENNPFAAPSAKVENVRRLLGPTGDLAGETLMTRLRALLADHSTPETPDAPTPPDAPASPDTPTSPDKTASGRRPETLAACVHTENYGTRSSSLIRVFAAETRPPQVLFADGHPCTAVFADAGALWTDPPV